jgi:hypothetical protein
MILFKESTIGVILSRPVVMGLQSAKIATLTSSSLDVGSSRVTSIFFYLLASGNKFPPFPQPKAV